VRTAEEIVAIWRYRRDNSSEVMNRLRRIRDVYNGDVVLPIQGMEEPAVANMILTGIDQTAGRIAATLPQVWFPPVRPGMDASEQRALNRRHAVMGWWSDNRLSQLMRQRARYLVAYGASPSYIGPDIARGVPRWTVHNPLACYPAEELAAPLIPSDSICAYNKTFGWLKRHYPEVAMRYTDDEVDDAEQVVILEYCDESTIRMIFAGIDPTWEPGQYTSQWDTNSWTSVGIDLFPAIENRARMPLTTIPTRITLDRRQGQFDQIVGMYVAQAKLTALEVTAVERDIFPDTFLVSRPNERADFISGPHDGRTGEVNIVTGGDIENLSHPPGYQTTPMIDRLERGQRITGGVPAEFGGESTTNIRTGRRGDAVLSAVIDFPILEAQEALAEALEQENRIAIAIARGWWDDRPVTYHYTERGRMQQGTYKPKDLFTETDHHEVTYPVAGSDLNQLVVGVGQRLGLGTMSKRTAAELDPLIDDPEREQDRITSEALDLAMLSSIQNAASQGLLPPEVVARVGQLVKGGGVELAKALAQAQEEFAAKQAEQQAQAAQPTGAEGMMAQMAAEQTGEAAGMPTVPEAGQSLQNLTGLYGALRKTTTRGAGAAALGGSY
jgi:hypothetical protein